MLRDIIEGQSLVTCEPDAKVADVARLMESKNVGAVMVLDNDKPRGIITDRDIVTRCIAKNIDVEDCTVENVMTESVSSCNADDGVFDCIQEMKNAGVRRMPVCDENGKAIGIVSFGDLIGILSKELVFLAQAGTHFRESSRPSERKLAA